MQITEQYFHLWQVTELRTKQPTTQNIVVALPELYGCTTMRFRYVNEIKATL